jgi:putative membrane protein
MNARTTSTTIALVGLATASVARAHGAGVVGSGWWRDWAWEPGVVASLFFAGAVYGSGLHALRRATAARGKFRREAWCYAGGWLWLVIALVSPMHPWGQRFFSVHMVQHEVLMVLAAPLLVLGRPVLVMLSALPRPVARGFVGTLKRHGGSRVWDALANPFVAWLAHAIALWVWHVPSLFQSTLSHEGLHALQHATFLGTAVVFWHAVFFGPRRRAGYGMGVIYLFTTAVHSGALGALLTFATRLWYPAYANNAGLGGLTALEDQQLGGLIMWIPAGIIYAIAGLVLFGLWLRHPTNAPAPNARSTAPLPCASHS